MNVLTYAKNSIQSFAQKPFNRVDGLIMCWLSYFCYPDYLKGNESIALKEITDRVLPDKQMYSEAFNPKKSKKLFNYLIKSKRYRDIEFFDYREEKDAVQEKQFAALCIKLSPNEYLIAFRGTDPSFVGWKEDFNLAYRFPVPSQDEALKYVQEEMCKFPDGKFYIGGHSKGGNNAVYAAIKVDESLQKRLINIFNFDGPSFIRDIYAESGYAGVADKIIKIIPQSAFVGMLLEMKDCFSVIKSRAVSVLQHDPFSWVVRDDDFKYLNCRTRSSVRLEKSLNKWLLELTIVERERIIRLVFNALNKLDTNNFNVFFKTFYRQIPKLYREYKRLNADDKNFFDTKIKRLKQLLFKKSSS